MLKTYARAIEQAVLSGNKALEARLRIAGEFIPIDNEISILQSAINKTLAKTPDLLAAGLKQSQIDEGSGSSRPHL